MMRMITSKSGKKFKKRIYSVSGLGIDAEEEKEGYGEKDLQKTKVLSVE